MSVKSREKIALVVFLALIVLSLCGLGWYLMAGHSWNVAASNLDDTFGSMDGYTAIVYPGTAVEAVEDGSDGKVAETGAKAPDEDAKTADPEAEAQAGNAAGSASSGVGEAPGTAAPAKSSASGPAGAGAGASAASGGATGAPAPSTKAKALDAADAKKNYEDKGATVFALDTEDLGTYDEGVILKKGGHRFGVFGVKEPLSTILLEKQIAYFKRNKVDFVVAVTADKKYVEGVSGIDIAISTQDEDLFVMGETVDGTFYVDAPTVGSVGAILISPSNVVSAKVIQEL